MSRLKLTKSTVDRLQLLEAGQKYFYDTELQGFGIRVGQSKKTYFAERRLNGRTVRVTIGAHGPFTPDQARREAQRHLHLLATGKNPIEQRRYARVRGVTLAEAFGEFRTHRKNLRARTLYDYTRCVEHGFGDWKEKPLAAITREMVLERHRNLGERHGPAYANHAMRVLQAIFNFAIVRFGDADGRPLIPDNPVRLLSLTRSWYRVDRRKTVIKSHQIRAWYEAVQALRSTPHGALYADYLLLIFFTGLRREEAARLLWRNVDFEGRTLLVEDTKNHQDHVLPMTRAVQTVLAGRRATAGRSTYVFPGEGRTGHIVEPRTYVERVRQRSGVAFSIHDLRRTFLTVAESLDISSFALKRLVNHRSHDVTSGYIVDNVERLRNPAERICAQLLHFATAPAAVESRRRPDTGALLFNEPAVSP